MLPVWEAAAEPSWFGFPITAADAGKAQALVEPLERAQIETRRVFAGNIFRQPGFRSISHRVHDTLANADEITKRVLFAGAYPGLIGDMREYVAQTILGVYGTVSQKVRNGLAVTSFPPRRCTRRAQAGVDGVCRQVNSNVQNAAAAGRRAGKEVRARGHTT